MRKVPICIPLHPRGGKFGDDSELRFALRSIHTHFKEPFEIALVCKKPPAWITGCRHIPGAGLKSALRAAAAAYPFGFFWFYDDCCLLQDTAAGPMRLTPASQRWAKASTPWAQQLTRIRERLEAEGIRAWDYSRPHGPYWFDQSMVDEGFADWPGMESKFPWESWILSKRDWPRRHGSVKQYYGSFRKPPGPKTAYLNYNDDGNTFELRRYLESIFPEPSPFEAEPAKPPLVKKPKVQVMQKKNAIAISLYGQGAKYAVGAIRNAQLAKRIYPEFEVVVHLEKGHYAKERLQMEGARVVEHPPGVGHAGMLWRFETAAETERYDRVIFRDADSRIGERERAAVDQWIASGKSLHAMRDHANHRRPIMAGMWGLITSRFDVAAALHGAPVVKDYGDDEAFLSGFVWPALKHDCLFHTSRKEDVGEPFSPFPVPKTRGDYIGKPVDHLDIEGEKMRVVYLSPEKYAMRRERFLAAVGESNSFLSRAPLEWWKATPHEATYPPPAFRQVRKRPHWWAATCDHLRIMEETLVSDAEFLLLLEDDAHFTPDFQETFWRAWAALPANWKALRLGWHAAGKTQEIHPGILHRSGPGGLMIANLWNRNGLERAYDHFWHRRKMIIDIAFDDLRAKEPRDWYQPARQIVLKDPLAKQQGRDQ